MTRGAGPSLTLPRVGSFSGERFSVSLALAVPAADLRGWLAAAEPGHRAIYASGAVLPREAEAVKLVTRWKEAGLVLTLQRRDPADPRRLQYLIEKRAAGTGPAACSAARGGPDRAVDRRALHALLEELRRAAERGEVCGSNAALAATLGLPRGARGRNRAQYLLTRLVREGAVAVEGAGRNAPRVVTILAKGRACGKTTAAGPGRTGR